MLKPQISTYYNSIHQIHRFSGSLNETAVRTAFVPLINHYAERRNLLLVTEIGVAGKKGKPVYPDGVLKNSLRLEFGCWEAKDTKDNFDYEIKKKLYEDGYPDRNILFEDTREAVLYQEGQLIHRVSMEVPEALDEILTLFTAYEPAQVKLFNQALNQFKDDVPTIVAELRRLTEREADTNKKFRVKRDDFLQLAQSEINPSITVEDVREMLIQHILTEDIFNNVFGNASFHRFNNVARSLEDVINTFMTYQVRQSHLGSIQHYYSTLSQTALSIADNHEKQKFLKTVYENFYKVYNPKGADKLGVVYTPNEIVRFMIDATDWLLDKHFNKTLSDKGVDILDPATGTGTFIAELIDRINIHDLEYKYTNELHANEVAILPYYIANLNIEYTYQQRKGAYKEFQNICFVDTLDNTEALVYSAQQFGLSYMSNENADRIKKQNERKISVIIGNPPYNANQANFNDFNKNREYKEIDRRIKDTYVRYSTAQKTKVYDMYARFYRWSMDRIDKNGIIAFVTNRSFIDSRTFDGFRKTIEDEFDTAYIIDTRSDVRANPKIAGTSHNIFGIQTGVAVMFLVKKEAETKKDKRKCKIYYAELNDFWRKEEKLNWLRDNPIDKIEFERLEPDAKHNWINQTDNNFETLLPLIDKDVKLGKAEEAIFKLFSLGSVTNRDEWTYDFNKNDLEAKLRYFIKIYEKKRKSLFTLSEQKRKELFLKEKEFNAFLGTEIKFTRELIQRDFLKNREIKFDGHKIIENAFRPFIKKFNYFDSEHRITHEPYQMPQIFGKFGERKNKIIAFNVNGKNFGVLGADQVCDLHFIGDSQTLPLYTFDSENQKHENITDWALDQFREHFAKQSVPSALADGSMRTTRNSQGKKQTPNAESTVKEITADLEPPAHAGGTDLSDGARITKEDIFHYVYAVLHSPVYRKKYEQNLKREFPRVLFYDDFFQWRDWGKELMDLHINYETQKPFALKRNDSDLTPKRKIVQNSMFDEIENEIIDKFESKPVTKLRADKENGTIIIDSMTTLTGVPSAAWEYKLGNRSAIEWILDQYKEKTPSDATIREKFNTYKFADYKEQVIDLIKRVTTVSVKTMEIINSMPKDV